MMNIRENAVSTCDIKSASEHTALKEIDMLTDDTPRLPHKDNTWGVPVGSNYD